MLFLMMLYCLINMPDFNLSCYVIVAFTYFMTSSVLFFQLNYRSTICWLLDQLIDKQPARLPFIFGHRQLHECFSSESSGSDEGFCKDNDDLSDVSHQF